MNINTSNHQIYLPFKSNTEGLTVGFHKLSDDITFALEMKGNRSLTQTLSDTFKKAESEIIQELGIDKKEANSEYGRFHQLFSFVENGVKRGYKKEDLVGILRFDSGVAEHLEKPTYRDGLRSILQKLKIIDENDNFKFSKKNSQ